MNIRPFLLLTCAAALLVAGCKHYGPQFDAAKHPETPWNPAAARLDQKAFSALDNTNRLDSGWLKAPTNFFTLGPGDVIEMEIMGSPASRSTALVGPDGKIYYDLLPGIFVWGKTVAEVKVMVENEFTRFVRTKPEMTLTLRSVASRQIWLLGSVQQPGVYSLATPMTLLEAISMAGGTIITPGSSEDFTDLKNSFVMREGRRLPVDLYQLLKLGDLTQNIYLQPDDFVYLRSAVARNVYVLGAVARPNIIPFAEKISLVTAIAGAGGPVPYAYQSHVAIVRGSLAEPKIAIVDYGTIVKGKTKDVLLEPGDIVYMPFAPYRQLAIFGDQILQQFVRTIALNEGRNAVIKGAEPVGSSIGVGY